MLSYAHAGDLLTFPFEPDKIFMSPTSGRVYHPSNVNGSGSIGLIRSKLAIEFSKYFEFDGDDELSPTHFTWNGVRYDLNREWMLTIPTSRQWYTKFIEFVRKFYWFWMSDGNKLAFSMENGHFRLNGGVGDDWLTKCYAWMQIRFYRLCRLWCKLLYLVFVLYFVDCFVFDLRSPAPFLLYWYLWINGTSSDAALLISKSSALDSSIFSLASIAWMVISLLTFNGSFEEDPASSTGIEIFGLGFSRSSYKSKGKFKINISMLEQICFKGQEDK